MGFSYSILLAFGLQIYLKPFLLTHGYSFQLSPFQSIPFDRGKLSKSCCDRVNQWLDLRTSRSKEGGNDMTLVKDALDFSLNSAPQAPFSLVQLTEFYFSSHELNSARLSLV